MKIYVTITAHVSIEPCNEETMVLYDSGHEDRNFLDGGVKLPFLNFLKRNFPLFAWDYDDGDDNYETAYSQYVAYTEGENTGNYVLATLDVF